ncbi:MAG: diguanylate cyclase, partial [Nitrospira sp.]|nr:diguanylate cyclase [Nitrospira sp.]
MGTPIRILIVEDSEDDMILLLRELQRNGYEPIPRRVETLQAMQTALEQESWDLVVSDYSMPGFTGKEALVLFRKTGRDVPFIIVSGSIGDEIAVETMREGATDYLLKGNLKRLGPAVQRALQEVIERRERKLAEAALAEQAIRDPLTGLYNRRYFNLRIAEETARADRNQQTLVVLLCDLDHFKTVNDTQGHLAGDEVLKAVAKGI